MTCYHLLGSLASRSWCSTSARTAKTGCPHCAACNERCASDCAPAYRAHYADCTPAGPNGHSHGWHDPRNANGYATFYARSGYAPRRFRYGNGSTSNDAWSDFGNYAGFETPSWRWSRHEHVRTAGKEDEARGDSYSRADFPSTKSSHRHFPSFGTKSRKRRLEVQRSTHHHFDATEIDLFRSQTKTRGRDRNATGKTKAPMREHLCQR